MKIEIVERAPTGKVKSVLFGDKRHLIKTFAVLTGENPMNKSLPDDENRSRNKQLRRGIEKKRDDAMKQSGLSKEDYFRKLHVQYIPIKGFYKGNHENSYLILNLSLDDAKYFSKLFDQESFFFGRHFDDGKITVSLYSKDNPDQDYKLVETSEEVRELDDLPDAFSKYNGLKWKFVFDCFETESFKPLEVFNEELLDRGLDDSYTMRGRVLHRIKAYKGESFYQKDFDITSLHSKLWNMGHLEKTYFPSGYYVTCYFNDESGSAKSFVVKNQEGVKVLDCRPGFAWQPQIKTFEEDLLKLLK